MTDKGMRACRNPRRTGVGGVAGALDVKHATRRESLKQLHRRMILDEIRRSGPASRRDLALRLNLRPNTVTVHVQHLLAQRLLSETGTVETRSGRRPMLLDICRRGAWVIGVEVGDEGFDVIVSDLKGSALVSSRSHCAVKSKSHFTETLLGRIDKTMGKLAADQREGIRGIGVALPGLVDRETGLATEYSHFSWWRNLPIGALVAERFSVPTMIDNDTRALALAEKWFGPHRDVRVLLVVELSEGVGSAILLDGELYRGGHGYSGELGHVTINRRGKQCACGSRGCLETETSRSALLEAYVSHGGKGDAGGRVTLDRVVSELHEGGRAAIQSVREVGESLGVGLAGAINMLDPDAIVLCGDLAQLGSPLIAAARKTLAQYVVRRSAGDIEIHMSHLAHDAPALGAAAVAIEGVFRQA